MAHGLILSDWKIPCTMKKKSILFVLAAICLPLAVSAQKEREITLNEAIAMARMQSVDAAVALNELKTSYWEYRTFRADLLPEINLKGTLPNYNKSYGLSLRHISAYFGSHKDRSSQTFDNRLADTQSKTGSLCKVVHLIEDVYKRQENQSPHPALCIGHLAEY